MTSTKRLPFFRDGIKFLPDLQRLEFVLQHLPDEELLRALNEKRGRRRDGYPVEAIWRALVFRHSFIAALLRELRRNPAPLQRCGFDPLPRGAGPCCGRKRQRRCTFHLGQDPAQWRREKTLQCKLLLQGNH